MIPAMQRLGEAINAWADAWMWGLPKSTQATRVSLASRRKKMEDAIKLGGIILFFLFVISISIYLWLTYG